MSKTIDLAELSRRESERVEWKADVADPEDVVRSVCAFSNDFANMGGGYVVCGAHEVKDENGFQSVLQLGLASSRLKEVEGRVMAHCRDRIDPPVMPVVEELLTADPSRRILVFIVPATGHAHSYRASKEDSPTYYVRAGRETIAARNGLYRELLVRKGALEPWDRRPAAGAKADAIDLLALREYLGRMGLWGGDASVDDYLSDRQPLSAFVPPLMAREPMTDILRPRHFAVLLFGKNPLAHAPGAFLVVSFYPGTDRSDPTAERHEITGTVIAQAEKALDLLEPETAVVFDKEAARPNISKYPRRALQEAVINALVHRDYESHQPTRITVFRDRIEILSPGALPSAVDRDKFRAGKASPFWRNQTLSYFFNKLQLAQAEGQGIPTIIAAMRSEGSPAPEFDLGPESVTTVLAANPRYLQSRGSMQG